MQLNIPIVVLEGSGRLSDRIASTKRRAQARHRWILGAHKARNKSRRRPTFDALIASGAEMRRQYRNEMKVVHHEHLYLHRITDSPRALVELLGKVVARVRSGEIEAGLVEHALPI